MINIPVAKAFVLNIICRKGTIIYKAKTAARLSIPVCFADNFFRFDKPKCRGNKLVVAKGHTLRHSPANKTNRAGAAGIRMFQNNMIPVDGKNKRQYKIAMPPSQTKD
ncbi:hypothetical protein [Mucilaginibacter sp.]|uniref:hypothetical protein n=1 Tax=Mucilaginibacter sp. TaxID=1882438 RepID=UPI002C2F1EDB|nr:hypothetical protein [Mucilaginibacter sp.]HTI61712.1 hypothetical protein [Mucilaginibacter sp.]